LFGQTGGIFANRVLIVAVLSWAIAQALKVVFTLIVTHEFDAERIFGLGGMPSSHAAFVCSIATAVGIALGFHSVEFAIAFGFAMVVMTDAAGVRRAAGKQAKMLNEIVRDMVASGSGLTNENLKELLGHTPFEVIVGALLGVLIAVLIM